VIVVCPGLTQTNFSRNMLEQKAKMPVDHMRGMTAEAVALATLRALERGSYQVTLSLSGKLIALVSRIFPRFADWVVKRKVRSLFREEIAARKAAETAPRDHEPAAPAGV
jgi:short-subunit dehydrogenase